MNDYGEALEAAVGAAREAGEMLRQEFHRPGGPRGSGGHAEIDEPAERLLRERLRDAVPWAFLGEETGPVAGDDPRHLWLVDPNDGTASYLQGRRGSSVSIAALRDGVPVLGVVYAFAYPDDRGDLIAWAEGRPLIRNGSPITASLADVSLDPVSNPPPIVFLSQDADRNPEGNAAAVAPCRYIALPSIAYRLARTAVGDGVAAVSLSSPVGWDYAAGHALVRAAGGALVDERGNEIVYTPDGRSSARWCFGGAPAVARALYRKPWQTVLGPSAGRAPYSLTRPVPGQAVAEAGRLARAQGCLLGQLAGDALGGLVEFRDPDSIRREHPDGVRDLVDGGTWSNLAGQPTDDSEMALMLARMLVREGRYDRGMALDAYCHWWPMAWDRGSTLSQALSPVCRGRATADPLKLAEDNASQWSQSNGCLMRISPLGIFGSGQAALAADWARQDAGLTHPHPVCRDSGAVYIAAVATAVAEGCGPAECHRAALTEAERSNAEPTVRKALEIAVHAPPADYTSQMGWVLIALQNAFYQLLHAPSLEEGVVDTVMRGGDTDTTAAIAGALLGAVHGRDKVPWRWQQALLSCRPMKGEPTRHVTAPEFWPVDGLELAEALLVRGTTG